MADNPDYFLDELLHLLKTNQFISVHYTAVHCFLEHANVSHKKLKHIAMERNEERHANFIGRMVQYTLEQLGFLDKVSKDEQMPGQRYGRLRKGRRAQKSKFLCEDIVCQQKHF